jgi:hypothetical protein
MAFELINNMDIKFNAFIDDTFNCTTNKNGTYTTKSGHTYHLGWPRGIDLGPRNVLILKVLGSTLFRWQFRWVNLVFILKRSGYTWMLSRTSSLPLSNQNGSWTCIRKLNLPKKLKFMFWLACHNSVPSFLCLTIGIFPPRLFALVAALLKRPFFILCEIALSLEVLGSLLVLMIQKKIPTWM